MKKQGKEKHKIQHRIISKEEGRGRRRRGQGRGSQRALRASLWSPFMSNRVMVLGVCCIIILYTLHIFPKNSTISIQYLIKTIDSKSATTICENGLMSPIKRQRLSC